MKKTPQSSGYKGRATAKIGLLAAMLLLGPRQLLQGQSVDYGALQQLFNEPVTTSVNGSPQRVSDVPATMIIITAEEIRRSGAKDIPGVLRQVGGVDTLEWGNDDIDVSVRGYDEVYCPRLLVLLDGRQVYADDYGYTPWSTLPVELDAIRQIEVVKGPNSALFGFNATGGVINIITFNPLYDKVNTVSGTGGTQGLGKGSLVAMGRLGERVGVRLSAGGNYDDDFSTSIPASEEAEPRKQQYRGEVNVNAVIRLNHTMHLSFEASQSFAHQNEMFPGYQINDMRYSISSFKTQFMAESRIGLIRGTVYTNWLRDQGSPGLVGQQFNIRNQVTVAQLDDVFAAGPSHTLRLAGEYRHDTENTTPFSGGTIFYDVFSMSGMWDWKLTPKLSLTNALRIDRLALGREGATPPGYMFINSDWNRSTTELSFNSAAVWKATVTDSARLMVSRGAELPSLVLSGAYLQDTPYVKVSGSPYLKPSVVTNYEVGWDHVMLRRHMLFRGDAFYQNSARLLSADGGSILTATAFYAIPGNIGSSDGRGLELGFRGASLAHYRWSVDYRPEWITDHLIPSAQNAAAFVEYQHTTPVHLVKANLGWANKRWELDGYLHYQTHMQGLQAQSSQAGLTSVPGFLSLDGRAAYKLTNLLTWSVAAQNLTHASQIQTSGPAVERRVLGTLSFHF